ncbi:MAG: UDP-N-acetylmuramate dehydrogenase [Luteibaculaceae bacterium]|jgi:UDP-N-acetylmuramate dehydrogenase
MQEIHDKALKSVNTFGLPAQSKKYTVLEHETDIPKLLAQIKEADTKPKIMGGGSNVLLVSKNHDWIIANCLSGIEILEETGTEVQLKVAAGENWHQFVLYTLQKNWNGLENLSLIPGKIGAAPIQNIGAYGVEIKDVLNLVHGVNIETGLPFTFDVKECQLGYRDSIFKNELKGKTIITSIEITLKKGGEVNTKYGDIQKLLDRDGISKPSAKDISNAVIEIRMSKLPDPAELGNGGSFFKNPIIDQAHFNTFISAHPEAPNYPMEAGKVKVPAGWLIEQAGWKGFKAGNYGVHNKQALVLVNYGGAEGSEIADLAQKIIGDVQMKFGIQLEPEINFW